jgi:putative endonuclease
MEFVVYILFSESSGLSYVGYTGDLIDRFKSHNDLGKSGFTAKHRPWIVVHVEFFNTKQEAMKREKYYKSGRGLYRKKEIIDKYLE